MKSSIKIIHFFLCLFIITGIEAQSYYFEYNNQSREIYKDIIDLKLSSAEKRLELMKLGDTNNLVYLHLENYLDFFELFINEDFNQFKILEKNKARRIELLEKHLDDSDPYKNFAIAEINLQWALTRSKFDQLFKSGREIYSAYNLLKENVKNHPDFIYNKKSLSIIHSLIETITLPGIFKKVFGIEGSIELGIEEINQVIDYSYKEDFIFIEEADAIYAFILFYQKNEREKALDFILESRLNPEESLLANFLITKLLQRSGKNELALETLKSRPTTEQYSRFFYLDYLEGLCLLRKLDTTAIDKIKFYLQNFEGRHYIKEAYQKLAWYELVFNESIPNYKYYMSLVESKGYKLLDDDKQAYKEFKSDLIPNPILLKSRLLCDGGYYNKALNLMTKNAYKFHTNGQYTLEFNYRIGRIYQALKNYPDAIKYLSNTVNNGFYDESYFACNAALQLGKVYEKLNMNEIAMNHYKECLKIYPEEYRNSLHQKAKTGLERLKK